MYECKNIDAEIVGWLARNSESPVLLTRKVISESVVREAVFLIFFKIFFWAVTIIRLTFSAARANLSQLVNMPRFPATILLLLVAIFACVHGAPRGDTSTESAQVRRLQMNMGMGMGESDAPSDMPSDAPSDAPSDMPSDAPSDMPSAAPVVLPTANLEDGPDDPPKGMGMGMGSGGGMGGMGRKKEMKK